MSDSEFERSMAAAEVAERGGQAATAARHYTAALALRPDDARALNALGLLTLYGGDADEAIRLLRRATLADPQGAMLWLNLSSAYRQAGDDGSERAALAAAIDLDPYSLPALVRKAQLHERRGEEARASAAWRTLLDALPPADQRPEALRQIATHAAAYVGQRSARFSEALSEGLAQQIAQYDGAERRRFDACVAHVLGKRQIYTSTCAGLHFPFLPADEFLAERRFPWFADLEAQTAPIRAELESLLGAGGDGIVPYVDQPQGARPNLWTPLNRTTKWGAFYLWHYGVRQDAACARCPVTAAAVEAVPRVDIPGRAPTAFFSLLEPRTRIPAHTGVTNTRVTVHLPLIVPENCGFRVGGETRAWVEGRAFAFDDTIEHEAWNDSDHLRAVLIVDVWNPYLTAVEQALVRAFYVAADATGLNPESEH